MQMSALHIMFQIKWTSNEDMSAYMYMSGMKVTSKIPRQAAQVRKN